MRTPMGREAVDTPLQGTPLLAARFYWCDQIFRRAQGAIYYDAIKRMHAESRGRGQEGDTHCSLTIIANTELERERERERMEESK